MLIKDRYYAAVNSKRLAVDTRTTMSDTDVLGAYGLASRKLPLGVALERLLSGDTKQVGEIVSILSDQAWRQARAINAKVNHAQANDIARAVLAWYRNGTCQVCKGHGFLIATNSPTLTDKECPHCVGGKIHLTKHMNKEIKPVAEWLVAKMERELAFAGPEAMKKLAPRLEI